MKGLDESLAILDESVANHKYYDAIFGHSQGAMMAAIWLAKSLTRGDVDPEKRCPKVAVLSGASYPQCQAPLFDQVSKLDCPTKTVHTIGKADNINPPVLAEKLAGSFKNSVILRHHGGHIFPQDEVALATMADAMREAGLLQI